MHFFIKINNIFYKYNFIDKTQFHIEIVALFLLCIADIYLEEKLNSVTVVKGIDSKS
jgi:hypothetical protein